MTIDLIHELALVVPALLPMATDDGVLWLLAAGPAGAAATYWALWRDNSNTDKTHQYERDTIIEAQPVQGGEEKVDHISKTRDSDIDGDNSKQHRQRVQRIR